MPLPPDFQFSQHNLQDFLDCPRRFELRYLLKVDWPAPQTEPQQEAEQHMRQGQRFHQMARQFFLNVPAENLQPAPDEIDLSNWWLRFLECLPGFALPPVHVPEMILQAPFAGHRLVAKYDLIACEPGGNFLIMDWKTSLHLPNRYHLQERIQTRLYPFLLVLAGSSLNAGAAIQPEQVTMTYWFSEHPHHSQKFSYSLSDYSQDHTFFEELIHQISVKTPGTFPLTQNEKLCAFCTYRSLCDRGQTAGNWQEEDQEPDDVIDLDFDQLAEIDL